MKEPEAKKAVELTKEQGDALVPYFSVDREMHRLEKFNKRLFILALVLLIALAATNGAWIVYENQFEDIRIEQDGETTTGSNYFNGTGELNLYGESETSYQNPPPEDGR